MAVLMGGKKEESYGPPVSKKSDEDFDIIDITSGNKRYSAKFVNEASMELKANMVNLYNEIKNKGFVEYIYCVKRSTQDPNNVSLEFKKFRIDENIFDTIYSPVIKSLSSAVNNNTTMIDSELERSGMITVKTGMIDRFNSFIKNNKDKYDGKIIPRKTARYGVEEAIITVTLKNIMDLNPETIASLNISIFNLQRMFRFNRSKLLDEYFKILTNLVDLTEKTNLFVYGNTINADTVISSANELVDNVNFVKTYGEN
jgi:hypothetical protein